jgi:hypothetical protein
MKVSWIKASLAGAALLPLAGSPASAAVMVATFTGTVASGTDASGWFGAAGADLTGDAFSITYTYDTSRGYESTVPGSSDSVVYVPANPITNIAISVNSIDHNLVTPSGDGLISVGFLGGYLNPRVQFQYTPPGSEWIVQDEGALSSPLTSLSQNFSGAITTVANQSLFSEGPTYGVGNVFLADQTLSITNISAGVPEPATWAVMMIGLGGIGAAMRSARRRNGSEGVPA